MVYDPTALEFITSAAERAQKITKTTKIISSKADTILSIYNRNSQFVGGDSDGLNSAFEGDAREVSTQLMSLRWHVNNLYHIIAEPETYHGATPYIEALTSDEQKKLRSVFDVKATVWDKWVLIKMPLLPTRYSSKFKPYSTHETNQYWVWYFTVFEIELAAELQKIASQIPTYSRRNLAYLHIKNHGKNGLPDADNFDTKHVTDIVVEAMGGNDGPGLCSFVSWAEVTPDLPEGTYLCVSSKYESPPSQLDLKRIILGVDWAPDT